MFEGNQVVRLATPPTQNSGCRSIPLGLTPPAHGPSILGSAMLWASASLR
jgi:hypothetical protein